MIYWAYSAIKSINWTVGSTTVLSINGPQLLHLVLEQCETLEKREQLLNLAGRREYDGSATLTEANVASSAATSDQKFYAVLPLPWSSISSTNKLKPFPVHLMDQPIEMQIIFRAKDEICTAAAPLIAGFNHAQLHFRYW